MKKIAVSCLAILMSFLLFTTQKAYAFVYSNSIDMLSPVYIEEEDSYIVTGYSNYNGDIDAEMIFMYSSYSFAYVYIEVKEQYDRMIYHLEKLVNGSWVEIGVTSSTARTGQAVFVWGSMTAGNYYRMRIENYDNWFGQEVWIEVWWYAIA